MTSRDTDWKSDNDLSWLLTQIPESDDLAVAEKRVAPLLKRIPNSVDEYLPITLGSFGPWGSGKTTILALAAKTLMTEEEAPGDRVLIYFNAWKYAGHGEIVASLAYKILKYGTSCNARDVDAGLVGVLPALGHKYGQGFGTWAQGRFGFNPLEVLGDVKRLAQGANAVDVKTHEVLAEYYTRLDRAQDIMLEMLSGRTSPIIVLVDELDRCDPGEAFEAIKELRAFFGMRGVGIVFILAVNPEPITRSIANAYGLTASEEGARVLEKFVDHVTYTRDPISLNLFIERLWQEFDVSMETITFLHAVESGWSKRTVSSETLAAISTRNHIYANLRVLRKTAERTNELVGKTSRTLWTCWHLEILKVSQPEFRHRVALHSHLVADIAKRAHESVIQALVRSGNVDVTGHISPPYNFAASSAGDSPYAVFTNVFRNEAKNVASRKLDGATQDQRNVVAFANELIEKPDEFQCLRHATLVAFESDFEFNAEMAKRVTPETSAPVNKLIPSWDKFTEFRQLASLLEHY